MAGVRRDGKVAPRRARPEGLAGVQAAVVTGRRGGRVVRIRAVLVRTVAD